MLIIGDIHAGNRKLFSTITSEGLNSRFVDTLIVLKDIATYATETNQQTLIFLGDIFEAPGEGIHKDVLIWTHNAFKRLSSQCEKLIILSGNHDLYRGQSILTIFDDIENCIVITKPTWIPLEEYNCCFIPFARNQELLYAWLLDAGMKATEDSLLFGHFATKGVRTGVVQLKDGLDIQYIPTDKFKYIFLGHIHSPQVTKNIIYPGSILQNNMSERGEDKYIIDFTNILQSIKIHGPQFHSIEISNDLEDSEGVINDTDYYDIILKQPVDETDLPQGFRFRIIKDYSLSREERLDIKKESSKKEMLQKYLDKLETTQDKNKLISLTMDIWNKAEGV